MSRIELTDPSSAGPIPNAKDTAISVCKVCRCGVFRDQEWRFARRPLGISHNECLDGAR